MTTQPILDQHTLTRLSSDIGDTMVSELLQDFVNALDSRVASYEQSLAKNDYEPIARDAHMLKTEAATFGALQLASLVGELEMRCASSPQHARIAETLVLVKKNARDSARKIHAVIRLKT